MWSDATLASAHKNQTKIHQLETKYLNSNVCLLKGIDENSGKECQHKISANQNDDDKEKACTYAHTQSSIQTLLPFIFLSYLLNHTPSDGHVLRMGPAPISEASIDENMTLFHPAPVETVYTVATARPIQSKLLYVFNHARCCPVVASGPCTHTGVDRQHICTCDTHQCCKGIAHCPGTFVLVIRK